MGPVMSKRAVCEYCGITVQPGTSRCPACRFALDQKREIIRLRQENEALKAQLAAAAKEKANAND